MPSRSRLTRTLDSLVARSRVARRGGACRAVGDGLAHGILALAAAWSWSVRTSSRAALKAAISSGRARGDAQPAGGSDLADQHPAVEQRLPQARAGRRSGRRGRSWRRSRRPRARDRRASRRGRRGPSRSRSTAASISVGVGQGDPGDGLRDGRQVVRQPDEPQRVDEGRVRGQVAEPPAGEGEGLGHRAADRQPRPPGQQLERARRARRARTRRRPRRPRRRPGLASTSATTTSSGSAVPVGLFGLVTRTTSGRVSRDRRDGRVDVDGEVLGPREGDEARVGVTRVLGVHRVGRGEAQHGPARARRRPAARAA